jgi:serine/threonine protein phosphatase PrpC
METPGALRVLTAYASETGRRSDNQDFAAAALESPGRMTGVVAAVADGVGGAKGGRVAAELCVRGFIDGYLGQSEALSVRQTAAHALECVNRWIHAQGHADPALEGMACTFTGVVLRGRRLHVLHVGDTRLYRLRDGKLAQLTRDHRPEGGGTNLLTRAVGAEEIVRIDYAAEDLQAHDRLLICCDGVHDTLGERRIEDLLNRRQGPEAAARDLVAQALDAGSEDNVTALVLDVLELPAADLGDLGQAVAALPMRSPPQAGESVDGYLLETLIADGRYSRVFRARDAETGRVVLAKFPKPQTMGAEASARAAFLRESWVASRVQNPWIGSVIEPSPERRTCLYLLQPFYEGETLERRLVRKPPIGLAQGLEIAAALAKAIAALHRAGVIHRDIKPDNVILERGGGLKLVDLGVSRLPHLEAFAGPEIPGTPSYMAPELYAGDPGDERSDIFALGVTLYRAFSGGPYPYGEVEAFATPQHKRLAPLSQHRPDLPAWLETTLAKALAPDPADRFQDAFELAYELETNALSSAPARVRRRPLYERDPLRFWQVTALILAVLLLVALATR